MLVGLLGMKLLKGDLRNLQLSCGKSGFSYSNSFDITVIAAQGLGRDDAMTVWAAMAPPPPLPPLPPPPPHQYPAATTMGIVLAITLKNDHIRLLTDKQFCPCIMQNLTIPFPLRFSTNENQFSKSENKFFKSENKFFKSENQFSECEIQFSKYELQFS